MPNLEKAKPATAFAPPDAAERSLALDPSRSFLVQAPAGSGKTHLLTQRFLRLLGQAEKPDEIVAITFTNAAAEEMRQRILEQLERAELAGAQAYSPEDAETLPALAQRALQRARALGWQLLDQPAQLRITTIDAFCRSLALQCPLSWGPLSGLGGRLDPVNQPEPLYRRAATRTIEQLKGPDSANRASVEALLRWRDNNWNDVESLIVRMLQDRNRWYQEFVFSREVDWEALRRRLEAPFCRAVRERLERLAELLDGFDEHRDRAMDLARFACGNGGKSAPFGLAERAELPSLLIAEGEAEEAALLEDAADAHRELANFLMTTESTWRSSRGLNVNSGFPATPEGKAAKARFAELVEDLQKAEGLEMALAAFQKPIPTRYTNDEWDLIRHCFRVLRVAAGELKLVFAETGSVDFTEVAQIALGVLAPENGLPSDFAMRQADGIRHLLVDEFQDTSRNQHQLLSRLIAAWPDREGRSCFCVGDPMQSIYGFREAEVELFERLKTHGLEMESADPTAPDQLAEPFRFEFLSLRTNFRTVPSLVEDLNTRFEEIFAKDDGSGVRFSAAEAARPRIGETRTELHLAFTGKSSDTETTGTPDRTRQEQLGQIVQLIQRKLAESGPSEIRQPAKLRIAVLGRTKKSLILVADALRKAGIGFRAIELVPLRERPEVLDALSLARALLNPVDRTAWLGVLRAPWCGLTLEELHLLTSADDAAVLATAIPALLRSRLQTLGQSQLLNPRAFQAASRVAHVLESAIESRPAAATFALGTWLESVWKALGGEATVNEEQRQNLRLLWSALDKLPEGELDLVGPGLDAALKSLFALPDPAASSDFGVQLMTIHKSKGLEFEVVIVPDLEAAGRNSDHQLISWLERGLSNADSDQLTEFLIAPIQAKGEKSSAAKRWVDGVKRARETQEMRRLLYVAATRAREELHLFARPRYSQPKSADTEQPTLDKPCGLLETAWPAFGPQIETQFAEWLAQSGSAQASGVGVLGVSQLLESLAAEGSDTIHEALPSGRGNLLTMPSDLPKPTLLRRLPLGYEPPALRLATAIEQRKQRSRQHNYDTESADAGLENLAPFARTEGGLQSRLEGVAVHEMLERLVRLRRDLDPSEASLALADSLPSSVAALRAKGLTLAKAQAIAGAALSIARETLQDPIGGWILAPHSNSEVESHWTGLLHGRRWNLRPDRVFYSAAPEHPETWWVVDYKTTHAAAVDLDSPESQRAFLEAHRDQHIEQLSAYAEVLRSLRNTLTPNAPGRAEANPLRIRAGIYYPRLQIFDSWEA